GAVVRRHAVAKHDRPYERRAPCHTDDRSPSGARVGCADVLGHPVGWTGLCDRVAMGGALPTAPGCKAHRLMKRSPDSEEGYRNQSMLPTPCPSVRALGLIRDRLAHAFSGTIDLTSKSSLPPLPLDASRWINGDVDI